jgi:hypothetical protein
MHKAVYKAVKLTTKKIKACTCQTTNPTLDRRVPVEERKRLGDSKLGDEVQRAVKSCTILRSYQGSTGASGYNAAILVFVPSSC